MKPTTANALNALVLIAAGLYGYFGVAAADGHHSPTALIPAAFGVLFIIFNLFWAGNAKVVSHIVVVLTLVLLIMCIMRFVKPGENGNTDWNAKKYIFAACILSNALALIIFIRSFIAARRSKA